MCGCGAGGKRLDLATPLLHAISYEYHFTATTGLTCFLIGASIIAALAVAVILIVRCRK
jgi:hypothetical protein